jgi:DNA primase
MRFQGREIDPIELWANYVEFPPNVKVDGEFLPKVICPNPDHDTSKRHFQINAQKGLVHCFAGCGISGTYSHAIGLIEGIDERKARKVILRHTKMGRRNVSAEGNSSGHKSTRLRDDGRTRRENSDLEYSSYIPQAGIEYLRGRGIMEQAMAHFQIGWDAEELRLVIPAKDITGKTRLLIKRAVRPKDHPKYLYTEGFPKTSLLFGACDLDPGMIQSQGIVLVEGSFDRINLWLCEIPNTVATLGTGISEIQARLVERFRPPVVYLMFDRDTSGVHGIEIARRRLPKSNLRICRYPKGKFDPGELTREEAIRSIERAIPVSKFFNPNARGRKVA